MDVPTLTIRLYGDPCLRRKSKPLKEVGAVERLLIQSLIDTMHHYKGVGLAAPQVGVNERIFIMDVGKGLVAVVNPEIVKASGSAALEEGCLSIPNINVVVKRPEKIDVRYRNEENRLISAHLEDLSARVFQHETDHLNGRLIIDYAGSQEKKQFKKKLDDIQKGSISDAREN